jgi:hypothetical protein
MNNLNPKMVVKDVSKSDDGAVVVKCNFMELLADCCVVPGMVTESDA